MDAQADPRGEPYYWIIGDSPTGVNELGTDVGALSDRYVSITPLQLDSTDYHLLSETIQQEIIQLEVEEI